MIREVVGDGIIQQYELPKPSSYWKRNKKQSVNYIYDSPFATERQLEDQRLLQVKNRNPQLLNPTKVERVRSEIMIAKHGSSRPVAIKANVINKVVREASGVHNYTIIAPPRAKASEGNPSADEDIMDAETHPLMAPYAREAKSKPVVVSFGHRPRSASRMFHAATMRMKLRHQEVAKHTGKSGFGLPVAVLAKVLRAPKILSEEEQMEELDKEFRHKKELEESSASVGTNSNGDYGDLFFTEKEEADVFGGTGIKSRSSSVGGESVFRFFSLCCCFVHFITSSVPLFVPEASGNRSAFDFLVPFLSPGSLPNVMEHITYENIDNQSGRNIAIHSIQHA
jgi:hypothetical protein